MLLLGETLALALIAAPPGPPLPTLYDPVKSAEVWIQKDRGRVVVCGNRSRGLLERLEGWNAPPAIGFERDGEHARVNLTDVHRRSRGTWIVCFGDHTVLDLHVWLADAKARLYLEHLDLRSLDLQLGRGDADLRLGGARLRDSTVQIRAGRGNLNVRFDQAFDVVLSVARDREDGDLEIDGMHRGENGTWVSEGVTEPPATIQIHLEMGPGDVHVAPWWAP